MTSLVNRLGYVALNVTDLDAAIADATSITGLSLVERNADSAQLTSNRQHAELVLHRAGQDAVRAIGLEAPGAAEVQEAAARARRLGWNIIAEHPSLAGISHAVTIVSAEGHVLEIHTPLPEDQPRRHDGPGIHPRRLCHVNLASQDPAALADLLAQTLGLRLSERTEGCELMWMRASDGRHHTVGIAKSAQPGLHHFAWEFAQFSDFMRLGDLLDTQDRLMVWGPGRHGCGDNLFSYYVDRAGFMVECSAEMEVILDDRPPSVISCPPDLSNIKVVNRWGAPPPRDWIEHMSTFAAPGGPIALAS
ncbi:VOC family protein [Xanthobacter oligotrophicus]|uniref:VOC family protein n=1 Tax=Xanthobacter oligotrophicus TaxID=2607286 RepID=UPI0011F2009E|nr:VOC family protein [Xanthobacter oligotrophicus]MCG5236172.1 VOC family protein [Xanthobacter oligotrophicus]